MMCAAAERTYAAYAQDSCASFAGADHRLGLIMDARILASIFASILLVLSVRIRQQLCRILTPSFVIAYSASGRDLLTR